MPLDLEHVHVFGQIPGTSERRLIRTLPAKRICQGSDSPIWIQGGVLYYAGGIQVRPVPEWALEAIRTMDPKVREKYGLRLPGEPQVVSNDAPVVPVSVPAPTVPEAGASYQELAKYLGLDDDDDDEGGFSDDDEDENEDIIEPVELKMWTCGECSAAVELRKKGVHIAKHRNEANRAAKAARVEG